MRYMLRIFTKGGMDFSVVSSLYPKIKILKDEPNKQIFEISPGLNVSPEESLMICQIWASDMKMVGHHAEICEAPLN